MASKKWVLKGLRLAAKESVGKIKQFALEPIADAQDDDFSEVRKGFAQVGVWAFQNSLPILKAVKNGKPFTVLVGMRPAQKYHVGHLTLMREIAWLIERGGQLVFLYASFESGKFITADDAKKEMNRFAETFLEFSGVKLPNTSVSFSDWDCEELKVLEERVSEHLTVRKILQLYGWEEGISVAKLRTPSITAAAFLFSAILFPDRPTLVLSDINQIVHAEATKIVARKVELPLPSYSYRMLLPSLRGPTQRMSINNPKSVIHLGENRSSVKIKLEESFSGGLPTPEEQRKYGGNPHSCSFFKIAEVLQSQVVSTRMYENCISGISLCGECKQKHIPLIAEKIPKLAVSPNTQKV